MQEQCPNCGRPLSPAEAPCAYCARESAVAISDRRARLLIAGVIAFAAIGVSALAAITYLALSSPADRSAERENGATRTGAPRQVATANTTSAPTATGTSTGATANAEVLARYSEAIEPLLAQVRTEMDGVVLNLKQFLKTVNRTSDPRETRRVIDDFRDRLKEHEQRLTTLSGSLKAVAPPLELQHQHERLSAGIAKYVVAVQSYIRGLSAYSFNQIRASQNDLEGADREIKAAADEFQQALAHLTIAPQ